MNTRFLLLLALAVLPVSGFAATGFFGNFYIITDTGGGNVYNQVVTGTTPGSGAAAGYSLAPDGVNPQFGNFGSVMVGSSMLLKGFEYKTFEDNFSDVTHANLYYRIYNTGSPSGSFAQMTTNTPVLVSGNNNTWSVTNGNSNLLAGLNPGNYTMEVYTESYTNGVNTAGNIFGFQSGANPTATFTVVPEPSRALLGMTGLVLLCLRRRRA